MRLMPPCNQMAQACWSSGAILARRGSVRSAKAVKDLLEEEWEKMMTELGRGAKIPDLDHVGVD